MIVTHRLTLGQITFILRLAVQILSYGGLFLIGLIVLATIPRIASAETHGVINRIVGKSTATKSSVKWAFNHLRGKTGDSVTSIRFLIAILLLVMYSLFVSVSDVGFIGFYACSTTGPSVLAYPASISTDVLAQAAVVSNLVNGTDPATVNVHRCDAIQVVEYSVNVTERVCTVWHNSTYADPNAFKGLNTTDSDILMPRQLKHLNQSRSQFVDLNSFYISPGSQRIVSPFISNGLAVAPHPTGVRAVFGVPQLAPQQKVILDNTMAIEADIGCMPLGIYTQHNPDATLSTGVDIFATNSTWRNYTGPAYFQDVLSKYVDDIREIYRPFFNVTTLDSDGFMLGINASSASLVQNAAIESFFLPSQGGLFNNVDVTTYVLGNCSNAVYQYLNITSLYDFEATPSCSLLAIAGSTTVDGGELEALSRMLCASATQVNMVSATVEMSVDGSVSVDVTRLPSDLNYLLASYWDANTDGNDTVFEQFLPVERFTLADNPSAPTSHFVPAYAPYLNIRAVGPGSGGGNAITRLAPVMINSNGAMDLDPDFNGIKILDEGNSRINFSSSYITRWGGQVGASFILASMAYNGWAARDSSPIMIHSTGGFIATCYKPWFALAFLPLVFTAFLVTGWALPMIFDSSFGGYKRLQQSYGGMSPYIDTVYPGSEQAEMLLAWQNDTKPRLEIVSKEQQPPWDSASNTALQYLKAGPSPRS